MATVEQLKAKVESVIKLYDRLRARSAEATRAGLSGPYQTVMGGFSSVVSALRTLTGTGSLADAVKALFGSSGTAGMGFIWPVAFIAVAYAAVTAWETPAKAMQARLDDAAKQRAAGVTAEQAAKNVATAAGDATGGPTGDGGKDGLFDDLGTIVKWGTGLVLVALVAPPLIRAATEDKNRSK